MKRVGHIDPDALMSCSKPHETRRWMMDHAVIKRRRIPARKVYQLLLAHGGFRSSNRDVFPRSENKAVIADLCKNVLRDPSFIIMPNGQIRSKFLSAEKDGLTFQRLIDAVHILEDWRDPVTGPGRDEQFVGSLKQYYPLDCGDELAYLRRDWARFSIIWDTRGLIGYNYEKMPQMVANSGDVIGNNEYTKTTFGSHGNLPMRYKWCAIVLL